MDDNAFAIAVASVLYLLWCWFFSGLTVFDKIINVILVLIPNVIILGHVASTGLLTRGPKLIPEGVPNFYKKAFLRDVLKTTVSFAKDKSDLRDTALLINNHSVFIDQFPDPKTRIDLYSGWNKLTNNKSVAQLFLPDGTTRVGASVILPLSEKGYNKIIDAPKFNQLFVLQNLNKDDIELSKNKVCIYLIDILLVDINRELIRKSSTKPENLKKYLSGVSLHLTLWHLAHIDDRIIAKLPKILLQPDVPEIIHCTYTAAGFSKINQSESSEPSIGDYLEINSKIAGELKKKNNNGQDRVVSECLKLLKIYKYERHLLGQ